MTSEAPMGWHEQSGGRPRSTWGETVALILRDCEAEVRLDFMRALGQWKRISTSCIEDPESHPGDRLAAEHRLVKLTALEEHLQREMESDAHWRQFLSTMWRRF